MSESVIFEIMRLTSPILALVAALLSLHGATSHAQAFTDLFNGKDLTQWDGDPALWSVRDGAITGRSSAEHPARHNTFLVWKGGVLRDFELRLKFRIVADNAAGAANSGIQYRSRLVDSAGWVVAGYQADLDGPGTYVGGLYEERGRGILARPAADIRATLRPGQWNDYVIVVQGARQRYYVNDKPAIDAVDLDPRAAASGILALQLHAGPPMTVQFKDIRLKRLAVEWPVYGGGPESMRYSPLTQINRDNVKNL